MLLHHSRRLVVNSPDGSIRVDTNDPKVVSQNRSNQDTTIVNKNSFLLPNGDVFTSSIGPSAILLKASFPAWEESKINHTNDELNRNKIITFCKELPQKAWSILKSLNPIEFKKRLKHDVACLKEAIKNGDYETSKKDVSTLSKAINGRIFASLLFSDACAYASVPVSWAVQAATGNAVTALLAGIGTGYAIAVASFQAGFGFVARDMYKENHSSLWKRLKEFQKDLFPIHARAFGAAIGCYAISLPIMMGIANLMNKLPDVLIRAIPVAPLEAVLSIMIFEGLFLKMMSGFNQQHSERLARKYANQNSKQPYSPGLKDTPQ